MADIHARCTWSWACNRSHLAHGPTACDAHLATRPCAAPQVPRVALAEIGPRLNLSVRRSRQAPLEMEKEALRQPQVGKRKVSAPGVGGTQAAASSRLAAKLTHTQSGWCAARAGSQAVPETLACWLQECSGTMSQALRSWHQACHNPRTAFNIALWPAPLATHPADPSHAYPCCAQEKNVGSSLLDGKVGRIYMPKQTVDTMALAKPKGLKRERRVAAGERKSKKAAGGGVPGAGNRPPKKSKMAADAAAA